MGKKSVYAKIEMHKLFDKSNELFESFVKKQELRNHCIEVGTIMRFLAKKLEQDEEKWAAAGKLHDIDYEETEDKPENHGRLSAEILKEANYPQDLVHAILAHNEEHSRIKRENNFDYALSAADNVSGLIYAYGLMRGGLKGMEVKGLKKKMKDKAFAANVRRDLIYDIEEVMPLDEFLEISIEAMQSISDQIGFEE